MSSSIAHARLLAFLMDSFIIGLLLALLWHFILHDLEQTFWYGLHALPFVYYLLNDILLEGQTIGKKFNSIKVTPNNFQIISPQRWILRNVVKVILAPISIMVWIFSTDRSRALHDNIANTQIISV